MNRKLKIGSVLGIVGGLILALICLITLSSLSEMSAEITQYLKEYFESVDLSSMGYTEEELLEMTITSLVEIFVFYIGCGVVTGILNSICLFLSFNKKTPEDIMKVKGFFTFTRVITIIATVISIFFTFAYVGVFVTAAYIASSVLIRKGLREAEYADGRTPYTNNGYGGNGGYYSNPSTPSNNQTLSNDQILNKLEDMRRAGQIDEDTYYRMKEATLKNGKSSSATSDPYEASQTQTYNNFAEEPKYNSIREQKMAKLEKMKQDGLINEDSYERMKKNIENTIYDDER